MVEEQGRGGGPTVEEQGLQQGSSLRCLPISGGARQ